jgi:hypothetical protein
MVGMKNSTTIVKVFAAAMMVFACSVAAAHYSAMAQGTSDHVVQVQVTFSGGYDTDPRDRGRPVVLVAAGIGVPADVFREAFSRVKPAPAGTQPDPAQVQLNKQALLSALGPYGVTNERLDLVSNYYRYVRSEGQLWRHTPAAAYATVVNGVVTGFVVTSAGAGYSSPPTVSVRGYPNVSGIVTLSFTTHSDTNGSIKSITLEGAAK